MTLRDKLLAALRRVIQVDDRILVIHSSLAHLRANPATLKYDVLSVLRRLLDEGYSLALPTFTLSFMRGQAYHAYRSVSETGVLGDWALSLSEFSRTRHPIYSYAVAGNFAEKATRCSSTAVFGEQSIFEQFEKENARIVMLGCSWRKCTQFHRYEEEAAVPYREYKIFSGKCEFAEGDEAGVSVNIYARRLELVPPPANDFSRVEENLRARGLICQSRITGAEIQSVACQTLAGECRALLAQDSMVLINNKDAIVNQLARFKMPVAKIALLGSANLDIVANYVRIALQIHITDRPSSVFTVPFGRLHEYLIDQKSDLWLFKPDIAIYVDRGIDITGADAEANLAAGAVPEVLDQHLGLLERYARDSGVTIVVHKFSGLSGYSAAAVPGLLNLDKKLESISSLLPNVHLFDPLTTLSEAGAIGPNDSRLWYLGRIPYSDDFSRRLANRYVGFLMVQLGLTVRLVAVDLDNTLWGGVVGEDGISGLQIGGDYPGNAFRGFQQELLRLKERGVALAVTSKNDSELATQVFDARPEMALALNDFATVRANWEPKWRTLQTIAKELNLGLGHILFADDNPVEREQMRRALPEVRVIDLPSDPALYSDALRSYPGLSYLRLTDEDKHRSDRYRERQTLVKERDNFDSVDAFWASLGVRIHIVGLDDKNIARAEQLVNKTNQFNTTTRRYSAAQLRERNAANSDVLVIGSEDRFSTLENVGLLIVDWNWPEIGIARIDLLLLSCRVLGRGIESGLLGWLRDYARNRGMTRIEAEIVSTERNTPVRDVFARHGFEFDPAGGKWIAELSRSTDNDASKWVTVVDHLKGTN